ncbi:MAG: NAD(P)-dependent alcohol dehydrogenase [Bacteroidales bacterium]
MKKIIYKKYGDADVLKIADSPVPEPSKGEVLVKVMAAGINPVDYKVRNGSLRFVFRAKFPRTPGGEMAGIIEKNGPGASKFNIGDKVFAMLPLGIGGYSEYVCVKEDIISKMPDNISFNEAAAIPLAGITALQSLRDKGHIRSWMHVLINGGSGGVGSLAIQIAKAYSSEVTAVCSEKNIEFVQNMGADHVINYEKEDFTQKNNQYDIVFDAVAKSSFSESKRVLKRKGTYITTIPKPSVMFRQIINPLLSRQVYGIMAKPGSDDLNYLAKLVAEEKLKPQIEKVYELEEAPDAHHRIETGRVRGKLVIAMNH